MVDRKSRTIEIFPLTNTNILTDKKLSQVKNSQATNSTIFQEHTVIKLHESRGIQPNKLSPRAVQTELCVFGLPEMASTTKSWDGFFFVLSDGTVGVVMKSTICVLLFQNIRYYILRNGMNQKYKKSKY